MSELKLTEADVDDLDTSESRVYRQGADKKASAQFLKGASLQCFYVWAAGAGKGERCPIRVSVAQYGWDAPFKCDRNKRVLCSKHGKCHGERFYDEIAALKEAAQRVEKTALETVSMREREEWLAKRATKDAMSPPVKSSVGAPSTTT